MINDLKKGEYCINTKISNSLRQLLYKKFTEFNLDIKTLGLNIKDLNALAEKHVPTAEHCIRVGFFCEKIALVENLDPRALFYSGLNHDYGKKDTPKYLLEKTGTFTQEDMELMRLHPIYTMKSVGEYMALSGYTSGGHHLFQDNPYPERKVMDEIPLPFSDETKKLANYYMPYVSVADTFDSIITRFNDRNKNIKINNVNDAVKQTIIERPLLAPLIRRLAETDVFEEHMKFACNKCKNDMSFEI